MRLLLTSAVVAALMWPTGASGYSFGDWASDHGFSPGAVMPERIHATFSSIDSLIGIGEYDWTSTPTSMLGLGNNQLTSIESGDFSGLTNLDWLDLHNNQISSIEPGAFSGLTNLKTLWLGYNQLSSIESVDFSSLTNLTYLNLAANQLSSIESADFSVLTNLRSLSLSSNQLSSIESGDFDGLTNLRSLSLNGNQLSSIESGDFSGLTNLEELWLGYNQLSSIESVDFSRLTNLRSLDLSGNQLSSIESGDFDGLTNLRSLSLNGNQLSIIESDDFSGLTNLDTLILRSIQLSSIESGAFSGLTNLTELWLDGNITLTELNLSEANFSSLTRFNVYENTNIRSVSLRNTVANQTSFQSLLAGGHLSYTGIGELGGITEMDLSGVDFGNITDLGPLYVMDDLTDLWLADTSNVDANDLDVLLDNLATIEGTATEGVLHMTQADYDAFNTAGGGLLATWNGEEGHHVEFVVPAFPGDYNGNGSVEQADLDLVLLNWGSVTPPDIDGWNSEQPPDGQIDQNELDRVLLNWGSGIPDDDNAVAVPEPGTAWMVLLAVGSLCLARSRRTLR